MKKGMCLFFTLFIIFGLTFAQEDEILNLKGKIIDLQNNMGFASYVPLPEPVLDKSGTLLIYYEPINVFTNIKDGLYEIWYTQDMTLLKENGEVVSNWNDILTFHYTTKKPVMDLFAQNSIELKGMVPAGKYKFKATLKDKLTEKTATHIIDFEIR